MREDGPMPEPISPALRVATYNLRGLKDDKAAAAAVVRAIDPDVLLLQEKSPSLSPPFLGFVFRIPSGGAASLSAAHHSQSQPASQPSKYP